MPNRRNFLYVTALSPFCLNTLAFNQSSTFSFDTKKNQFLLNQKPFQIRSGEMHPARIPVQYWRHRIQMAKAMGMNTIAIYVMWNYHEVNEGKFDFKTENRDIPRFIKLCQEEGLYVILRPGPYVCGEWDLGGIPPYLLEHPDIVLRANSQAAPRYMAAAARYIQTLATLVKPLMIKNSGPIIMVQIENEFGSYGRDDVYLEELRQLWLNNDIDGPFYTQDGLPQLVENKTTISGAAIGLSGGEVADILSARKDYPKVPVMSGELYPGWLTHWGDPQWQGTEVDVSTTIAEMMRGNFSFNIYVIHGGTNFGFSAGANTEKGQYQPDVTSYDYAAPINEQGAPTACYFKYRQIIADSLSLSLPPVPAPIKTIATAPARTLIPTYFTSLWENLPAPLHTEKLHPMESLGQNSGFILYQKDLPRLKNSHLQIDEVHDYATVHIDRRYVGAISRPLIDKDRFAQYHVLNHREKLSLGSTEKVNAPLDILVEAMGRINYGRVPVDRKGLLSPVLLSNTDLTAKSEELSDWRTYLLPMDTAYIEHLKASKLPAQRPGCFFTLTLHLDTIGDTFIDMQHWTKGVVWMNGRNLGRYWKLGPQKRLYCPAPWLKKGENRLLIFDLHQTISQAIRLEHILA